MKTDPFVGTFRMSANGQVAGNVTITQLGGNQYKIDTGNGYDIATKNGSILSGNSQGIPFLISISGNNLIMELQGVRFDLTRISSPSAAPSAAAGSMTTDPFVGTFTASTNGQAGGSITIRNIGNGNYNIDTGNGADNAIRNGNALEGTSEGIPFRMVISGNNLVMELLGAKIDLLRTSNGASGATATTSGTGTVDPRLIGMWSKSSTIISGDASSASRMVIVFLENGTFQFQSSHAAGGGNWSMGRTEDPVQTGTYAVTNVNQQGGILIMNGAQETYYFARTGDGEMLMGWGNDKKPWTKIR